MTQSTSEGGCLTPSGDNTIIIVLLGKNSTAKRRIGNTLLKQDSFTQDLTCEEKQGEIDGMHVCIIKTPDFFDGTAANSEEQMKKCMKLYLPGPHVFLLAVQGGTLTQEETAMFKQLKENFRERMEESMMVILTSEEEPEKLLGQANKDLRSLLDDCGGRFCVFSREMGSRELVGKLVESWRSMSLRAYTSFEYDEKEERKRDECLEKQQASSQGVNQAVPDDSNEVPHREEHIAAEDRAGEIRAVPEASSERNTMTVVLLGQTGCGKSASGNTILGKRHFESRSSSMPVTFECQVGEVQLCGISVRVIDTPDFFNEDLEQQGEQIQKCKELSQPGPAVYLLVMQLGRFTEGERIIVTQMQQKFGQEVIKNTIVLFSHKEELKKTTLDEYVGKTDPHLQKLITLCDRRCHAFNNNDKGRKQVTELMEVILEMQEKWLNIQERYPRHNKLERKNCTIL